MWCLAFSCCAKSKCFIAPEHINLSIVCRGNMRADVVFSSWSFIALIGVYCDTCWDKDQFSTLLLCRFVFVASIM
jgi:hypothetical protein